MIVHVRIPAPVVQEHALISAFQQIGKGHLAEQNLIKVGTICTAYMESHHCQAPSLYHPPDEWKDFKVFRSVQMDAPLFTCMQLCY